MVYNGDNFAFYTIYSIQFQKEKERISPSSPVSIIFPEDMIYRYLLIVTLIESRGPCIVGRVWAQLRTVDKCRGLESRRWEKKSSRLQLKPPSYPV